MREKLTLQSLAALVFTGVLGVFLLSVGVKFALRNVLHAEAAAIGAPAGAEVHAVEIDWAAQYPFTHTDIHMETVDTVDIAPEARSPFAGYTRRVEALKASVEAYATDDILFHDAMTEAANSYDRLLGWSIRGVGEYNALVTLPDGYLTTVFPARDMSRVTEDIAGFAKARADAGTPVLYVQGPFKVNSGDAGVYGVVDFTNQNADALVAGLRRAGTDVLDLREAMESAGRLVHASFYRTDHHWLPETGLFAAGAVAERLNRDDGFAIDTGLFDEAGFTREVYEDWFLGSQGKKATLAACAPEDFTLLYPQNDMRYTLEIPSLGLRTSGGFDTLYQKSMLGSRDYYNDSPYSVYFYSDVALKRVHNETVANGKRLLVLSDSFGNTLTPFLCRGIEFVDVLDLRYFTGSLEAYLVENAYDAILIFYSADLLGYDDATPESHTGWHDFR